MLTRETFRFLSELKAHNQRDWFNQNKPRYQEHVKQALDDFLARAAPEVAKVSPRLRGGAMRIYRDTRFSKDKSPYKTHLGLHFSHASAGDWEAPGYYLHVAPAQVFFAAGVWHPDAPVAKKIREAIAKRPAEWKKVTRGLTLEGDRLARPPRGFPADHALIEELKRKDFCAVEHLSEKAVTAPAFVRRFAALCKKTAPLMRFMTEAVGLRF